MCLSAWLLLPVMTAFRTSRNCRSGAENFGCDPAFHHLAKPHRTGIDTQIDVPGPAFLHAAMNFGQHFAILDKGSLCTFKHLPRNLFIVGLRVAMLEPEIAGIVGINRCHEIIRNIDEGVVRQIGVIAARAGACIYRHVERCRWQAAFVMLFVIAVTGKGQDRCIMGRRRGIQHSARHNHPIIQLFDVEWQIAGTGTGE